MYIPRPTTGSLSRAIDPSTADLLCGFQITLLRSINCDFVEKPNELESRCRTITIEVDNKDVLSGGFSGWDSVIYFYRFDPTQGMGFDDGMGCEAVLDLLP